MISQIGSCARGAPCALDKARSAATGMFRSVILTYLGQIVSREPATTKGSLRTDCTHGARALMGGPKHTGCRSATQKYKDRIAMAEKPYDRLEGVIWYDGKLVPWGEATLHVLSHGLHYASSVFEGERAYGGGILKCTEHSERLKRSAELLDFDIPYSVAEIDAAKRLVLEKNGQTDAYVRPVSWRGSEMMGVSAQNNKIHFAIATWQWPSYFHPVQRLKGIRLDLADYRRPAPKPAPARPK